MNSYDIFIYEFVCFMNSYMNSGVPRFQMPDGQLELDLSQHHDSVETRDPDSESDGHAATYTF